MSTNTARIDATRPQWAGTTRPDVRARRAKEKVQRTEAQRKAEQRAKVLLQQAADLEQQAATLTHSIAALDEQRQRVLIAAYMKRQLAEEAR